MRVSLFGRAVGDRQGDVVRISAIGVTVSRPSSMATGADSWWAGHIPSLRSTNLPLCARRIRRGWPQPFGYPSVLIETLIG